MKNIFLFIPLFFLHNHLFAQVTEVDFLNSLANASTTSKDFAFSFNQPGEYNFDSSLTLSHNVSLQFKFNAKDPNIVNISNKTFQGFKDIVFTIENATSIILSNCRFINCGTVYFDFGKEEALYTDGQTDISIQNCEFTDTNLKDNGDFSIQLYLRKARDVGKDKCVIKNVEVSNCNFSIADTSESFLTSKNLMPSVLAILVRRDDNNVAVSNIKVKNNRITFTSPYFRSFGIIFSNDIKANFKSPDISIEYLFLNNNNIIIQNNFLTAVSNDPGHSIFIQGPFENVRVTDNEVIGFGANFPNQLNQLKRDASIQLYGGRATTNYSDDLKNVEVSYNQVIAVGTGIRLSGFYNASVTYNNITILPDAKFYSIGSEHEKKLSLKHDQAGINCKTGNYKSVLHQSKDLIVRNNKIFCNAIKGCIGIDIDGVKSFTIRNNQIFSPNNYGIIYHSNKGFVNQEFGISLIENNVIDFGNQNVSSLNSSWYINYGMKFSGINISREFNPEQQDISFESLIISNNTIKTNVDSGIDAVRVEKLGSITDVVIDKDYKVKNNFLRTERGVEKILEIDY